MLTEWAISNFKSIDQPIELKLSPLTILAGINSSGKSTVLQSILMVCQTFLSPPSEGCLNLNGKYLHFGSIDDIQHCGPNKNSMFIGIGILPHDKTKRAIRIESKVVSRYLSRPDAREQKKPFPFMEHSKIAYSRFDNPNPQSIELLYDMRKKSEFNSAYLSAELARQIDTGKFDYWVANIDLEDLVQDSRVEKVAGISTKGLVPERLLISVNNTFRQLEDDMEWLVSTLDEYRPQAVTKEIIEILEIEPSKSHNITPEFRRLLQQIRWSRNQEELELKFKELLNFNKVLTKDQLVQFLVSNLRFKGTRNDFGRRLSSSFYSYIRDTHNIKRTTNIEENLRYETALFPPRYEEVFEQVNHTFTKQIYYIGPLRAAPSIIFADTPTNLDREVGQKGEFTAALLDRYRNMQVDCPLPPSNDTLGGFIKTQVPLIEALTIWLRRMGLVDSVDTQETYKVGYRLTVNSIGYDKALDLTNVGVGISQVLPTMVQALLMEVDSTLLLEQPELHLHPKVQSVLADFLLGMTTIGKQIIVETHSEHLINRLRRRIVESMDDHLLRSIGIYFAEKHGARSTFSEVKPNEYGAIIDWPKGFFDESEEESSTILRLQMEKRRNARRK